MAGRPILQELNRKIENAGGDDAVFDAIAAGIPIGKIAAQFGVSRPYLYTWRDQPPAERAAVRKRRWAEAMEARADLTVTAMNLGAPRDTWRYDAALLLGAARPLRAPCSCSLSGWLR